jgi:3-polyprenyl-4-hydroxybenzoate decarboxylase
VLEHVLARVRWDRDFFIFSNTSMDTLDYTSGKVNEGSKAIVIGLGEAIRELPRQFRGELPRDITHAEVFCPGCLVVQGRPYSSDHDQAARLASEPVFADWPLVVLHDEARAARSATDFLWSVWTRFEPAADIYAAETKVVRHHLAYEPPMVIDARKKPTLPDELIVRDDIKQLVDRRWREYFPN